MSTSYCAATVSSCILQFEQSNYKAHTYIESHTWSENKKEKNLKATERF